MYRLVQYLIWETGRLGVRERLGRLRDRWRDVLLMERRSPVIA